MEEALSVLEGATAEALDPATGTVLVVGALLVALLVVVIPLRRLLIRRESIAALDPDASSGLEAPAIAAAAPDPASAALAAGPSGSAASAALGAAAPLSGLGRLALVERAVSRVYEILLYLVIFGMTGLAVFLYLVLPDDGNRDFLVLYGGVVYAIGLLWAVTQLVGVRRRLRRGAGAGGPTGLLRGRAAGGLAGLLRDRIQIQIQSAPQVEFVDDAALDRAQRHLDAGGSLDDACAAADPRYREMHPMIQGVFRKAVEVSLEHRRGQPVSPDARR